MRDADPFEVTSSADFTDWNRAAVVEARTLFFLAAWLRVARRTRGGLDGLPRLHLACVGEPPDTVAWLARRTKVVVSIHQPWRTGFAEGTWNRLRALEVSSQQKRFLFISHKVLVMRSPQPTFSLLTGDIFAAASKNPGNIEGSLWKVAFQSAGLVASALPSGAGEASWTSYHPAVVFTGDRDKLLALWTTGLTRMAADSVGLDIARDESAVAEVTLAMVAATLAREGTVCRSLAAEDNARPLRFQTGALTLGKTRLLLLNDLCEGMADLAQLRTSLNSQTAAWREMLLAGCSKRQAGLWERWQARREAAAFRSLLDELYRRDVRPALLACGAYG